MKILVGVNTLTSVNSYAYSNHCQFWYRLGKEYPNIQFLLFSPPRMSIDRMRNTAAKVALENECDYLMFIDDDVLLPVGAFKNLLEAEYDIISGVVIIRGYPYNTMLFKFDEKNNLVNFNDWNLEPGGNDVFDVDAVGFSCVLIKAALIKELPPPYFVTGTHNTEDIYFCMKAIDLMSRENLKIGAHRKVKCGHLGDARVFTPENIEKHKEFDEWENPLIVPQDSGPDRGVEYLERLGIKEKIKYEEA